MRSYIRNTLLVIMVLVVGLIVWISQFRYNTDRTGEVHLPDLQAEVSVAYDAFGVPHIDAANEADMYFALGYVHAKDRLFQMELMRRLAQGELSEIFGDQLVETDTLFRTLGIHRHAKKYVERVDKSSAAWRALDAYIAGINAYQDEGDLPIEFDILQIKPRPFQSVDSISVSGYLAYSFAVGFRTEPVMTHIAQNLGEGYLDIFDLDMPTQAQTGRATLATLTSLAKVADLSLLPESIGQYEGSNAWAISGEKTQSGKPILASDPHIAFSVPGVWYEAHLKTGSYEFYGFHQALVPVALMGHNRRFGWGLTMFQNDDMDFYIETVNPNDNNQVSRDSEFETLKQIEETIKVKDADSVAITLRESSIGPIINDIYPGFGKDSASNAQPVSLWWAFLHTENPMVETFYRLSRSKSVEEFGQTLASIHAPGLNFMYADSDDNIAWWSAGLIPKRPKHVAPWVMLDGASGRDIPTDYYDFSHNPHKLNPEEGYIVSANQRPDKYNGLMVPGYYNLPARADQLINDIDSQSTTNLEQEKQNQRNIHSDYAKKAFSIMLGTLGEEEQAKLPETILAELKRWQGEFGLNSVAATLFTEWQFATLEQAFTDELGEVLFDLFTRTRRSDHGFYQLIERSDHPWWHQSGVPMTRADIVRQSFNIAMERLSKNLGDNPENWQWKRVHLFEQQHPLGNVKPLNRLFNLGPFSVHGSHAVPNNLSQPLGTGEQSVKYGPSTRRLIDFSQPESSLSILPAGQSGNPFDQHFDDQVDMFINGEYRTVDLDFQSDKTLILKPH